MPKKIFSEEQKQYIRDNYLTQSYKEIGEHLGFTAKQIGAWITENHLRKNHVINNTYFDNIDTSLKAYFLGFIYADGCVSRGNELNYSFYMKLQSQDRYILEKLNKELCGKDNYITHIEPYDVIIMGISSHCCGADKLSIGSKPLVEALIKNNIIPDKSHSDIFPIVDDIFFFDYLRGWIDGDGWYTYDKEKLIIGLCCHSIKPLEYAQTKLLNYGIHARICQDKSVYKLICSRKVDTIKLINLLYYEDNLLYLQRKYEKIKHLIGLAA